MFSQEASYHAQPRRQAALARRRQAPRQYRRIVDRINSLEGGLAALADAELRATADRLRERAAAGEANEGLLPESFALVREASKRTVGLATTTCSSSAAWP